MAELNHHDIIEAEDLDLERLRFIRIPERSELWPRAEYIRKTSSKAPNCSRCWTG